MISRIFSCTTNVTHPIGLIVFRELVWTISTAHTFFTVHLTGQTEFLNSKYPNPKTYFLQFCNCKNDICSFDDINDDKRLKIPFAE